MNWRPLLVSLLLAPNAQAGLVACLLPISLSACRRQPAAPVELKLTLVKTRLKPHDALWYVIEMKNVGHEDIMVHDPYWHDQSTLIENQEQKLGTFFEVMGPDGAPVEAEFGWTGHHGEYDFWANPPYRAPAYLEGGQWLKAGETLRTSPSIPAAVRGRNMEDMRRGPPGRQKQWAEAFRKDGLSGAYADWPGWARPPAERPDWAPQDARILTGFDFVTPGRYRIRAVYEPVRMKWIQEGRKVSGGLPEGTRVFRFESPWVDFEVAP